MDLTKYNAIFVEPNRNPEDLPFDLSLENELNNIRLLSNTQTEIPYTFQDIPFEYTFDIRNFSVPKSNIKSITKTQSYNLDVSFEQLLKEEGIKARVTSSYRPNAKTRQGRNSYHGQKDSSGNSMACDIVPVDQTFDELREQIYSNPRIVEWLKKHKRGVLEEITPDVMRKTGATGKHFHVGPDTAARKFTEQHLGSNFYAKRGMKIIKRFLKGGLLASYNKVIVPSFKQVETPSYDSVDYEVNDNLIAPNNYYNILPTTNYAVEEYFPTLFKVNNELIKTPYKYAFFKLEEKSPLLTGISDNTFRYLLEVEGRNFTPTVHRQFGESFVTGPYGQAYKYLDDKGNPLSKPVPFKRGEKIISEDWAIKNAKAFYDKTAQEWLKLLKGKDGLTQNRLDALVSASGGTRDSVNTLKKFVVSNWGNWNAIENYIRTFARTAKGKVLPGLVIRRLYEADLFSGKNYGTYRDYQANRKKYGV